MRASKTLAVASAALVGGLGLAVPAGASTHHDTFPQAQQKLESSLAARQSQLAKLTADVAAAKYLAASTTAALNASLSLETGNINALVTKVPTDTTFAELNADSRSMIRDNRVYAVMTPQVRDSIAASNALNRVATFNSEEANLGAQLQGRRHAHGFGTAWRDYREMTSAVARATVLLSPVTPLVLAQTPQGFPGNEHALVTADKDLLKGRVQLAYASYDKSVIELYIDGYQSVS